MIKLVCFFRRRPGMEIAAFHEHWLQRHGPLIADTPELARHLVRYEQNHRLASDYERDTPGAPGFDGATVQWLESMKSFVAFVCDPRYRERIHPDEERFIDRASITLLFTEDDEVKIDGGPRRADARVKLLALLKRAPRLTPAAFHEHWRGPHASLFREPSLARHVLAYHQSHRLEKDYERDAGGYDGLAEQWYASPGDFERLTREPRYREAVPADEERFLDRAETRFVLSGPPDLILG